MEQYKELSLAELCEAVMKNELKDIYFKAGNGDIRRHGSYEWGLSDLKRYQWFKRVVIE